MKCSLALGRAPATRKSSGGKNGRRHERSREVWGRRSGAKTEEHRLLVSVRIDRGANRTLTAGRAVDARPVSRLPAELPGGVQPEAGVAERARI